MLFNESSVESVVARRDRRMGGKHDFPGHPRYRLIEAQAFFFHPAAYRFEHRKSAVSFIQVQNSRRDSHRSQGAEASYPEQQFLANSNAAVAAVKARRKLPVL